MCLQMEIRSFWLLEKVSIVFGGSNFEKRESVNCCRKFVTMLETVIRKSVKLLK